MSYRLTMTVAVAALLGVQPAAAQNGAVARMEAYNAAVIAVMKENLPIKARYGRFASIVTSFYDVTGIAQAVAGPAWASAPAADRTAFGAALAIHSAASLAKNFKSYNGERFTVDPDVRARAGGQVVKVTINKDVLFFQLRQSGSTWRIVDVISGGVSQTAVQRSELAGTIASSGLAAAANKLQETDAKSMTKG